MKITTNKKINRIDRLSDYREMGLPFGVERTNQFQIEVSEKAFFKLKEIRGIPFRVCHDFDTDLYWLVIDGEGGDKKFDFTYLMEGNLNTNVNGWNRGKDIQVEFTHIDVATTVGLIKATMELLGEWLDRKYGKDCGFKRNISHKKLNYAIRKETNHAE